MPQTDNHAYNVPNEGTTNWDEPLNENFRDFDIDVEVRDVDATKGSYTPKAGAKFLALDSGIVYEGDGADWVPILALPRFAAPDEAGLAGSLVAGHSSNGVASGVSGATIAGGGRDDGTIVYPNVVSADYGTISGGTDNEVTAGFGSVGGGFRNATDGGFATVAGGSVNAATNFATTVAGGEGNEASATHATVGGGDTNAANGNYATASGGHTNVASATYSTVAGGSENDAAGTGATVCGGQLNDADGDRATVGGGSQNSGAGTNATVGGGRLNAAGDDATVGGGHDNLANDGYTTVGGGNQNEALGESATIAGGTGNQTNDDHATVGGGSANSAIFRASTVAGGANNVAGSYRATVGGGGNNRADHGGATVCGGDDNTANGSGATVTGGRDNVASGLVSTASGWSAVAEDDQSFVWNDGSSHHDTDGDGTDDGFSSAQAVNGESVTGAETFNVSASGGVRFVTGPSSVTYIPSGSTGWSTTSSRAAKTNVEPVDPQQVLAGVASLDVATWEYRDDDGDGAGTAHIGPMAEDFHDAFDVGDSDAHINAINADGVALAAIKGLAEQLEERDERIEELHGRIEALEAGAGVTAGERRGRAVERNDAEPTDQETN